jgi:UDP-GlcNAc:undecaprenyl-phosphate GlcNAc-1-phosphate transferase
VVTQLADLFPILLLSAISALAISPILIRLGPRLQLLDEPGSAPHKIHPAVTPAVGGLTLAFGLAVSYLTLNLEMSKEIRSILLGALFMLFWGVLDDRFSLNAWQKLFGQFIVAGLMLALGIQVQATRIVWLDAFLTLLWFVGILNAFNFVDSMDGLAIGLAAIASSFFMLVMIDSGQPELSLLAAGVLGSCLGVFVFNAAPARLFLGDSGSQLLGFLLAALGVAYVPAGAGLPQGVSWFTPILVLGVPIFDMSLVVFSRIRQGIPIYQGGRDHTYHRLLRVGLDSTRSVLAMQITAVGLGLIAFIALDGSVLVANVIFFVIILLGLIGIGFLQKNAG